MREQNNTWHERKNLFDIQQESRQSKFATAFLGTNVFKTKTSDKIKVWMQLQTHKTLWWRLEVKKLKLVTLKPILSGKICKNNYHAEQQHSHQTKRTKSNMKLKMYLKNRWQILACIRPLWIVTNVTLRTIQQKNCTVWETAQLCAENIKKDLFALNLGLSINLSTQHLKDERQWNFMPIALCLLNSFRKNVSTHLAKYRAPIQSKFFGL